MWTKGKRRVYHTCEKKKEEERGSCIKKSSMLLYGKMKDFKMLKIIYHKIINVTPTAEIKSLRELDKISHQDAYWRTNSSIHNNLTPSCSLLLERQLFIKDS